MERDNRPTDAEVDILKQRIASYEAQLGKLTPVPSPEVVDHSQFYDGKHLITAFISDPHYGSTLHRQKELEATYKLFEQEGVKRIYCCGDIVAGIGVYAGQHNELSKHTFDAQKEDVVKNFPYAGDAKTYFITGNHDASLLKLIGADIGIAIAEKRPDMVYLGQIEADIKLARNIKLRLRHPAGGNSYALSYSLQRYISSIEGGSKPQVYAQGHFHSAFYMESRNIHSLQVPCYERQSLYMKAKGLQPVCGAWLVTMHISDGSINRFQPELIQFFK